MGAKQIKRLTFLDVETTAILGPDSRQDSVIEIAAAVVDLESRSVVDRFDTLIKPWGLQSDLFYDLKRDTTDPTAWPRGWRLGEFHTKAGHFDEADWSKGIDYTLALDILLDRFVTEGATIAGQNPRFDIDHIRRDVEGIDRPWPKIDYHVPDLCSPALFLVMAGITDGVSLRNVIPWAYADKDRKQAHRARGDVEDAIRVFWAMFDFFTRGIAPNPGEILGPSTENPFGATGSGIYDQGSGDGYGVRGLGGHEDSLAFQTFGPCPVPGCPRPRAKFKNDCGSHS